MNCTNCRKEFQIGHDVLGLQEGVVGTRGFVPVADMLHFCSERCLKDYHDDDASVATLKRRTP